MIKLLQNKLKDEIKSGNKKNVIAYRNMIGKLKSHEIDSKSKCPDSFAICACITTCNKTSPNSSSM